MKRLIAVLLITVALFTLATYEVVSVAKINKKLEADVSVLYEQFEENKDNIVDLSDTIQLLKKEWDRNESALCLMFNHKELSCITDTLTRLLTSVKNNDYDNAILEVSLLKEFAEKNKHIMGFNFQNIL